MAHPHQQRASISGRLTLPAVRTPRQKPVAARPSDLSPNTMGHMTPRDGLLVPRVASPRTPTLRLTARPRREQA